MAKRYVFELIIEEGNDEFWEGIIDTGVNEVTECMKDALNNAGWSVDPEWGVTLNLVQYSNKP
jgi:hypothetical protein